MSLTYSNCVEISFNYTQSSVILRQLPDDWDFDLEIIEGTGGVIFG